MNPSIPDAFRGLEAWRGQRELDHQENHWAVLIAQKEPAAIADALQAGGLVESREPYDFECPPKLDTRGMAIVALNGHTWSFVLPVGEPTEELAAQVSELAACRTMLAEAEDVSMMQVCHVIDRGECVEQFACEIGGGLLHFESTLRKTRVTAKTRFGAYLDKLLKEQDAFLCPAQLSFHEGGSEAILFGPFLPETVRQAEYLVLKAAAGR